MAGFGVRRHRFPDQLGVIVGIAVIVTLGICLVLTPPDATAKITANSLKVSPVRSDIEILPGATKTIEVTVTNVTNQPITVRPYGNDFVAGDERGTPALILDDDTFAPSHSLKRFMSPLSEVTISPKATKPVRLVISVPKDASAGGYFGAVRFAPSTPDDGGQVNLSASVASLILLTVPGDTVDDLDLTDFHIQQAGTPRTYFTNTTNLQASVRFHNKGSAQASPFGKLTVKRGDTVVYEVDFNRENPRDMVLPDSARRWEIPLIAIEGFGNYTVSAVFTYGSKNKTVEVTESFWVVPRSILIGGVVGGLVLAGSITAIVVSRSRSKHSRRHARRHGRIGFRRY